MLLFEAMTFVFTLVATGLQFLNLYRTAWWLPHSYTNQAMVSSIIIAFFNLFYIQHYSYKSVVKMTISDIGSFKSIRPCSAFLSSYLYQLQ